MTEKRRYTDIVASLETHIIYIQTHLRNIDAHLERLNTQENRQNVAIAKNSVRIGLLWKMGWGSLLALITGVIAILLKIIGVY